AKQTDTETINYTYDVDYLGTLTNISMNNLSVEYSYDERMRVVKEKKTILNETYETHNSYDSMDRIVESIVPSGDELEFYFNEQGKIKKINNYITKANYNAFDNPLNRTYLNNKITEYTYDSENGRLTQIKTDSIQQLDYSYDDVGNVISILDPINSRDQYMSYDYLDRLTNVTINGSSFVYSYNEIGNILKIVRDNSNGTYYQYGDKPVHAPSELITGEAGIEIWQAKELYSEGKHRVREFYLANEINETIENANWTVSFGDGNINSYRKKD
ncbi:hypothetical protein COY62_04150, partial [bacterium (Candidatus Howlettbacteria) CG_4_10_14_0_8_um_filter_40_9]